MEQGFNGVCTAHLVREWVINTGRTMESFVMGDIQKSLNVKSHHEISATLTALRRIGAVKAIGRKKERISNHGTDRSYIYQCDDLSILERFKPRKKPEFISREPGTGVGRKIKYLEFPNTPVQSPSWGPPVTFEFPAPATGAPRQRSAPNTSDSIVNELLSIGIDLETEGATRQNGLRLLRLTEQIFRMAE